jgi:hypothetical protein
MDKSKPNQIRPPLAQALRRPAADPITPRTEAEDGWEAYRKWLAGHAGPPRSRRPRGDASLYSWKGYHSWAEKIRRSWDNDQ